MKADEGPRTLAPALQDYLRHLDVERRLAQRTREMYAADLLRLQASARADGVALELTAATG